MVSQNSINNTIAANDFSVNRSTAGTEVVTSAVHSDNTNTSSNAKCLLQVGGTSGGDPHVNFNIPSGTAWDIGSDNSDSDALKIGTGADPSAATNIMKMTTAGEITFPLQPAFSSYKSAVTSNATGDGTAYTIIADTEIFDIGSHYDNTTGLFTAPITGKYLFDVSIWIDSLAAGHTSCLMQLVTTARTYTPIAINPGAVRTNVDQLVQNFTVLADMTATDTASIVVTVSGSTKTVGAAGTSSPVTFFQGRLVP